MMATQRGGGRNQRGKCARFLEAFLESEYDEDPKYVRQLKEVIERKSKEIIIEVDDLQQYSELRMDDQERQEWLNFTTNVQRNTLRYISLFSNAVDDMMENITPSADVPEYDVDDVVEVLRMHRETRTPLPNSNATMDLQQPGPALTNPFPKTLSRRYALRILPSKELLTIPLRKVRAKHIGGLVTVKGVVTRVTEVKPLIVVATYTCDRCGWEIYQEVGARQFMPLVQCTSEACRNNQARGRLQMQTRGSKFIKFQEVRIQESPEEVPMGHIPCSLTVHVRGELTRRCAPGDLARVSGIFLPTPNTGFTAMVSGLIGDTYLECMNIDKQKKSYAAYQLTTKMEREIREFARNPKAYSILARSLAPEIYGHEDVKKALLLLMVGGVTRTMNDGMKIRGDINICLMGDPGVAKSQLLKHISTVSPRGIYTSGKGSSGVGLTAAVVKDTTTNELVLEGGALVLADMGVCCIDEFDKMEESDRTAIHEVMEQQTISIAKAGITTTLNARTAILAAANPAFGRYNIRRTPEENINLPAALLSRFDLLFLVLDKPDMNGDFNLARHVCYVHQHGKHPDREEVEVKTPEFMRAYIATARAYEPVVPDELTSFIVDAYVNMRGEEVALRENAHTYTTARTLLGILRLSQALARIRFSDEVSRQDIEEAMRLMHRSKASLEENSTRTTVDPISAIYGMIRDLSTHSQSLVVKVEDVVPQALAKGYTQAQLMECVQEYERLNVWCFSEQRGEIRLVS